MGLEKCPNVELYGKFARFVGTHLLVSSRHGGDVATFKRWDLTKP